MLLQCVNKENNPESFYQPDRDHLPMRGGLAKKPRSLGSIKTENWYIFTQFVIFMSVWILFLIYLVESMLKMIESIYSPYASIYWFPWGWLQCWVLVGVNRAVLVWFRCCWNWSLFGRDFWWLFGLGLFYAISNFIPLNRLLQDGLFSLTVTFYLQTQAQIGRHFNLLPDLRNIGMMPIC